MGTADGSATETKTAEEDEEESTGSRIDIQSRRMIIQEQSALVQSLNDEINRIIRVQILTLGVIITGISVASKNGLIDLGVAIEGGLSPKMLSLAPFALAILFGVNQGRMLWRRSSDDSECNSDDSECNSDDAEDDDRQFLPERLPQFYSNFELEPTRCSIERNRELIKETEGKIGILHLNFLLFAGLMFLWAAIHVVVFTAP